jgi:isopentenyl-diphosphate delta-isomerase
MTGGTNDAARINRTLASAAQATRIAMGLGSQRAAIEHPELVETFQVRKYAPDILLLANLGAVQLNYRYGIDECLQAVDMIQADALILHFNALQEAVQPEGDTRFAGLLSKLEKVCKNLPVPVIAKEVGWGFSEKDVIRLANAGVSAIDVAGAGGTSWTQVEMHRAKTESQKRLAAAFVNWGIPTSEAVINVRKNAPDLIIFASGGLRTGLDIAKCIALGASLGGLAGPFLKAASLSVEDTVQTIHELTREIQVCMFTAGAANIAELQKTPLITRS